MRSTVRVQGRGGDPKAHSLQPAVSSKNSREGAAGGSHRGTLKHGTGDPEIYTPDKWLFPLVMPMTPVPRTHEDKRLWTDDRASSSAQSNPLPMGGYNLQQL